MLENISLSKILFLDIETVPYYDSYDKMDEQLRKLWDKKADTLLRKDKIQDEGLTSDQIYNRAGIFAEFGKIICISTGVFRDGKFRIKSFYGDEEYTLLIEFANLLNQHFNTPYHMLCAHNGKEFDYPFIARRMLINGIKLPAILDFAGKKPWEVNHLDTMELWKFGDYKNYTSLALLAAVFNIPTPKDDIDGSQVYKVYWEEKDLKRIVTYCQKDTLTVAQILLKYRGEALIKEENLVIV
jgi:uncharacterized protein YprB with RNaseH-like and TPR domain